LKEEKIEEGKQKKEKIKKDELKQTKRLGKHAYPLRYVSPRLVLALVPN